MTDRMFTYHSNNAPVDQSWLGYIVMGAKRLNISFTGSTEDEVKQKMREFWAKDKEKRDANRAHRAKARERALKTKTADTRGKS